MQTDPEVSILDVHEAGHWIEVPLVGQLGQSATTQHLEHEIFNIQFVSFKAKGSIYSFVYTVTPFCLEADKLSYVEHIAEWLR